VVGRCSRAVVASLTRATIDAGGRSPRERANFAVVTCRAITCGGSETRGGAILPRSARSGIGGAGRAELTSLALGTTLRGENEGSGRDSIGPAVVTSRARTRDDGLSSALAIRATRAVNAAGARDETSGSRVCAGRAFELGCNLSTQRTIVASRANILYIRASPRRTVRAGRARLAGRLCGLNGV